MDIARIEQRAGVRATSDAVWDVLTDLAHWERWNPYERGVSGTIAFSGPITLTEALPGMAERAVEARVGDWQPRAQLVWIEKRGFLFRMIRYFEIEEMAPGNCIIATGAIFSGLSGELFHDKHRKAVKAAYGEIIEGWRVAAEAQS